MKDYNVENNKFVQNGLVIIDRLSTEIARFKVDRITDTFLLKFLDYCLSEIEKIKTTIDKNPRYEWVEIQEEIDRLYTLDNNLTGMIIYLDWKDGLNRGFYKHRINKKTS
jgi:hypothetical protein